MNTPCRLLQAVQGSVGPYRHLTGSLSQRCINSERLSIRDWVSAFPGAACAGSVAGEISFTLLDGRRGWLSSLYWFLAVLESEGLLFPLFLAILYLALFFFSREGNCTLIPHLPCPRVHALYGDGILTPRDGE